MTMTINNATEETSAAMTIQDFIAANGLTLELTEAPENPNMDNSADTMFNWHYVIRREGKQIRGYFSQGFGHVELTMWGSKMKASKSKLKGFEGNHAYDPKYRDVVARDYGGGRVRTATQFDLGWRKVPPTLADILDCLASDASGIDDTFEDWCGNYGYDTDSRKAERIYDVCKRQARELETLLGREAFRQLMEDVERL